MKNNFPKKPLILSVIFFIAFSAAFVFLYKIINNNDQKAQQSTIKWQGEANRRDEIRSLERSLQEISDDRILLETHFAKSSDIVSFLDTIEKLALVVGAMAEVSSVKTVVNNTGLVVGLKVTSNFEAIYKFITLLENSPYELDFLSMDLHKLIVPDALNKSITNSNWEVFFQIQLLTFIP